MSKESTGRTLFVAIALCLFCSIWVAGAAVFLKPMQIANKQLDKKINILQVANLLPEGGDVEAIFAANIEAKVVDLSSGQYNSTIAVADFDQRKASKDPAQNKELSKTEDIAGIGRRAQNAMVYLVKKDGRVSHYIFPVHGYGLWSTMYGFVALEADVNTVAGINFYQQAETPGLGGEIVNPKWRATWVGKQVFSNAGNVELGLVKGGSTGKHQIDALSGATLTSNGVTNLIQYWLGADGFGAYIQRIKKGA